MSFLKPTSGLVDFSLPHDFQGRKSPSIHLHLTLFFLLHIIYSFLLLFLLLLLLELFFFPSSSSLNFLQFLSITFIESSHHDSPIPSPLLKPFHKGINTPWAIHLERFSLSKNLSLINRESLKEGLAALSIVANFYQSFCTLEQGFWKASYTFSEVFGSTLRGMNSTLKTWFYWKWWLILWVLIEFSIKGLSQYWGFSRKK